MSELRPVPTDPESITAWVASLSNDDLMALTQQVIGAGATGGLGSLFDLGSRTNDIDLAPPPDEPSLLTLTIELRGSKPRIWRRLALPGDLTLDAVHPLFQGAMGWTDSHLHRFQPGTGQRHHEPYFITEFDEEEGDEGTREDSVRLDRVLREPKDQLTYLYDFGDGWEHRVTLESLAPLTPDNGAPACLGGARSCPPEDVGGIHGPHLIAAWLRAGAPADAVPEPLAELAQGLRGQGWPRASAWLDALGLRLVVELSEEDVRRAARPWLAVLDAVGAGTTLTAAGYLPPVVVEQVARDAGVTDWWIGAANREDLTPPVAMLRQNKGFEADAGWFFLLGLAAGEEGEALDAGVADLLTDHGWATRGGTGVSTSDARTGAGQTIHALQSMAGGSRAIDGVPSLGWRGPRCSASPPPREGRGPR